MGLGGRTPGQAGNANHLWKDQAYILLHTPSTELTKSQHTSIESQHPSEADYYFHFTEELTKAKYNEAVYAHKCQCWNSNSSLTAKPRNTISQLLASSLETRRL